MSIKSVIQRCIVTSIVCLTTINIAHSEAYKADIVVAKDGSGDYKSVQAAINAASSGDIILVKSGTYE